MDLSYAYANARVKAMESKLLSSSAMREVLEVNSVNELIEMLEETDYKDSFVSASTKYSGLELVVRATSLDFSKTVRKLMRIIPEKGRDPLTTLVKDYEIQNLSVIISSKATGTQFQETDLVLIDEKSRDALMELYGQPGVEEIVRELRFSEYAGVLQQAMEEYERERDFRVFIRALNAYYFEKLLELVRNQKNEVIKSLISSKVRDADLLVVLRVKKSNAQFDAMPFVVGKRDGFILDINGMEDYGEILQTVKEKYAFLSEAVEECLKENSLIPLEICLERRLIRRTLRSLRLSIMDFGTILSYLYLKDEEIKTIRKVAYAKQFGFTEELKKMIFTMPS